MNNSLMIIILVVYGITLIYAFIRTVDWYGFFEKRWGNDPTKCKVYVESGNTQKFYDGIYAYVDDSYIYYEYKIDGVKQKWAVAVPQTWTPVFVRGRVKVVVNFGEGIAKPESGESIAKIGAEQLKASLEGKIGVELVRSIKQRATYKMTTFLLIGAVLVGAIFMYNNYRKDQAAKQQETQQVQQENNPERVIEEEKPIEKAIEDSLKDK